MKRPTRAWFHDRFGQERTFDPYDASGGQRLYPWAWYDRMPDGSPARAQHERMLALHRAVHDLIASHPRMEEYFDSGPVDGSGYRDLYAEHTPAFADGTYATDLDEWSDMLLTLVDLVDLDHRYDDDDEYYFDEATRRALMSPLAQVRADLVRFIGREKEKALESERAGAPDAKTAPMDPPPVEPADPVNDESTRTPSEPPAPTAPET